MYVKQSPNRGITQLFVQQLLNIGFLAREFSVLIQTSFGTTEYFSSGFFCGECFTSTLRNELAFQFSG